MEKSSSKKVFYKRPQPLPTSVNSDSESVNELLFIHRRNIKDNTIDNNEESELEAERVDSSTGYNTDSPEEIVRERPQKVRKPPKLLRDDTHMTSTFRGGGG